MPKGGFAATLVVLAAACGDNLAPKGDPLEVSANLAIADRYEPGLFAPDLDDLILQRTGTTIVFVAQTDHDAAMEAYGSTWSCGYIPIADRPTLHCKSEANRVSLVFLDLPVGSLAERWIGDDRESLVDTIGAIVGTTRATWVRTYDPSDPSADPERAVAGALAILAVASRDSHADLVAFRGAGTAIGFRRHAVGRLAVGADCMSANSDGSLEIAACATAPTWSLSPEGHLVLDDGRCLQTLLTEELVVGTCGAGTRYTYFLDDAGHLFTGTLPVVRGDLAFAPLACLGPGGGRVRGHACKPGEGPAWSVVPAIATTDRAAIGITAHGRAVRLGDVTGDDRADLCEVATGLRCAASNGDGTFAAATRIDTGLSIVPASLALGDIDGDGAIDACGQVTSGILCAFAADGFAAAPWSTAFDTAASIDDTAGSLAILDADHRATAELCGRSSTGIICVEQDGSTSPPPRATPPSGPTWLVDLDGDDRADWCVARPDHLVCGRDRDRDRTGTTWSFGTEDPGTTETTSFGDIDGDGFADRCTATAAGSEVQCARGRGFGFGPAFPVPGLTGTPAIGDFDGDGVADLCTDAVACVITAL